MFTFETIAYAFLAFGIGLTAHVLWWRLARPKNDVAALFLCMTVPPAVCLAVRALLDGQAPITAALLDFLTPFILAAALGAAYVLVYPGAQAASPSMLILLEAARRGRRGVTREELLADLDGRGLLENSLSSLVHEGFARLDDGRLVPGSGGTVMVRVCQLWRSLLGLPEGEG